MMTEPGLNCMFVLTYQSLVIQVRLVEEQELSDQDAEHIGVLSQSDILLNLVVELIKRFAHISFL